MDLSRRPATLQPPFPDDIPIPRIGMSSGECRMKTITVGLAVASVVIAVTASVATGAAQAAGDTAFGAKPYLFSPPSGKLAPLEKNRASVYRSNLQREIRRLELKRPLARHKSMGRLNSFRSELSRIERATGSRRRR